MPPPTHKTQREIDMLTSEEVFRRNWSAMFIVWKGMEKTLNCDIHYVIKLITEFFDEHDPEFSRVVLGYKTDRLIDETMRNMVMEMAYNISISIRDDVHYDFVIDYILQSIFKKEIYWNASQWFKPLPPNVELINQGYQLFDAVTGTRNEKAMRWFEP